MSTVNGGSCGVVRGRGAVRVLGVDTSLRSTGVAVVEALGGSMKAIEFGPIKTSQGKLRSECLRRLSTGVSEIIDRTNPDAVAIEGVFFAKNIKTTMILGEARGAVISVCAVRGIPVFEYAPRRVKQAVVGVGSAGKEQVRKMIMTILSLDEEPQEDAGDALAIAICHLHNMSGVKALAPEEI